MTDKSKTIAQQVAEDLGIPYMRLKDPPTMEEQIETMRGTITNLLRHVEQQHELDGSMIRGLMAQTNRDRATILFLVAALRDAVTAMETWYDPDSKALNQARSVLARLDAETPS